MVFGLTGLGTEHVIYLRTAYYSIANHYTNKMVIQILVTDHYFKVSILNFETNQYRKSLILWFWILLFLSYDP